MLKKSLNTIFMFFMLLLLVWKTFAINETEDAILNSAWYHYLDISWDQVNWALWYYINHSKTPVLGWWKYETELSDIFEDTRAKIENLEAWTKYYFNIVSVDSEWNESIQKKEWEFKTLNPSEPNLDFWIVDIKAEQKNLIEVSFNHELEDNTNSRRNIRLTRKDNETFMYTIDEMKVKDKTVLEIKLEEELDPNTEYKLTVLEIKDVWWNIITSWTAWERIFETPDVLKDAPTKVTLVSSWTTVDNGILEITEISAKERKLIELKFNNDLTEEDNLNSKIKLYPEGSSYIKYTIKSTRYTDKKTIEIETEENLDISSKYIIEISELKNWGWESFYEFKNTFITPSMFDEINITNSWAIDNNHDDNNQNNDNDDDNNSNDKKITWAPSWNDYYPNKVDTNSWEHDDSIYSLWWTNISKQDLEKSIENENVSKLAETWPENIFLILIAISFTIWIFFLRKKA